MSYPADLFVKYKSKGILIDSNLLLLYFIGKYFKGDINRCKRTRQFSTEDLRLIYNIIKRFDQVVTSPNILTEVSNLSTQIHNFEKEKYFTQFCNEISMLKEEYVDSSQICTKVSYKNLGLTDMAIFNAAKGKYLVLTDDFPLYGILKSNNINAINFNHLRSIKWLKKQ